MVSPVAARMQGDDFQSRYFWLRSLQLLTSDYVERVELESSLVNVVDDVVVYYKGAAGRDIRGSYEVECCQMKYHVSQAGSLSCDTLIDPKFTHTKEPLLRRLYGAYVKIEATGRSYRLRLVSSWAWHPDDPLARCFSPEWHLRDEFFQAGPRSAIGLRRAEWAKLLRVSEPELMEFLRVVQFEVGFTLARLNDQLSDRLQLAGLKPLVSHQRHNPYDDLARKLLGQGQVSLTHSSFLQTLRDEDLFKPAAQERAQVTLRSRPEWAKKPLETQSAHLDLCGFFDGRFTHEEAAWSRDIPRRLREFITPERLLGLPQPIEVFFDCHLSIAFAAGTLVHPKSGLKLIPVQKGGGWGYDPWEHPLSVSQGVWAVTPPGRIDVSEAIVAVSVTHDIRDAVTAYAVRERLDHLPLLSLMPGSGIGQCAITGAAHAWSLGVEFPRQLRMALPHDCKCLHLFYSGPAALAFIIGTFLGGLPRIQLYEHDFERNTHQGLYVPSLALPLHQP